METKNILSGISVSIIFLVFVLSVTTAFGQEIDKSSPKLAERVIYSANNTTEPSNISKEYDEACPEGCKCMLEAEAKAKFNENYEKCSDDICGYGYIPTATARIKTSKYCFKEKLSPVQCPRGCECLDDNEAKEKGMVLCENELERCIIPTATGAAVRYGHCYEKPVIEEACHYDSRIGKCTGICPGGKVCKSFYIINKRQVRDSDTGTDYTVDSFFDVFVGIDMPGTTRVDSFFDVFTELSVDGGEFAAGKTACKCVTERCHYDSKNDKCVGNCPEGMKCRMFHVVSRTQVKDVDTGEILTPDEAGLSSNEIVIGKKVCKCVPLVVQVKCQYDARRDKCVGGCLEGMKCRMFYVVSKTQVKDVDTGELLTPDEAGLSSNEIVIGKKVCKCVPLVVQVKCQYDAELDKCVGGCPEGMKCRMFHVVSKTQVKDVDTGELLTPDEAGLSSNEIVVGKKVCKCVPLVVQDRCQYDAELDKCVGGCPEGMKCRMFHVVSKTQVKDVDTGELLTSSQQLTKADEDDIVFLYPEHNPYEQMDSDAAIEVRFATDELVVGRRVCKCIKAQVKECPQGCECLVEEKAKSKFNGNYELCADYKCGTETVIKPDGTAVQVAKKCFKGNPSEYLCPQGCICLKRDEGEKKGLSICSPSATECKITETNEWGICFELGEKDCRYDYDNNACVGTCPPGQKCQLTTIYRDPTTGKVTYAECHCKEPPVEECPDNCKCLTKKEGYENGLGVCNNEVTICDYVTTDALTTAAPNALGIPKYCFGEKVYAKCPDNCECMKREEAYEKGYELCGGVVRECGAGLYCFWRPVVEECGKDTLSVVRKINPKSVSPPAYVDVYLSVKLVKTLNGIIITEKIPEGMEPAWDYARVSFDEDVEKKIGESSFASDVITAIEAKWTSRKPDSWDPDTREAKWILKDNNGIKPQTFMYKLKVKRGEPIPPPDPMNPAGGIKYKFKGNWLISSGETCPIIGDEIVEIKPSEGWPPCPISDLELLKYIDMWSAGELTDMQILQAIKIWATSPPCPEFAYGTLRYGVNVKELDKATPKLAESVGNDLPAAPSDLTKINGYPCEIQWKDNSDNEDGFNIYLGGSCVNCEDTTDWTKYGESSPGSPELKDRLLDTQIGDGSSCCSIAECSCLMMRAYNENGESGDSNIIMLAPVC